MASWLKINNKTPEVLSDNLFKVSVQENRWLEIEQSEHSPKKLQLTMDGDEIYPSYDGTWQFNSGLEYGGPHEFLEYGGHYELHAQTDDNQEQIIVIVVLPTKITYLSYKLMLEEINTIALDLFAEYHSESRFLPHIRTQWAERKDINFSSFHEFPILKAIMKKMSQIFPAIAQNPYKRQSKKNGRDSINKQRPYDRSEKFQLGPMEEVNLPDRTIYLASRPKSSPAKSDLNSHENRLLRDFLAHKLPDRLQHIYERATSEISRLETEINQHASLNWYKEVKDKNDEDISSLKKMRSECKQYRDKCLHWVNTTFLKDVLLYHKPKDEEARFETNDPYYVDFYKNCYIKLCKEALTLMPNIERCIVQLAGRKVSEIYEIWCVLELTKFFIQQLKAVGYTSGPRDPFYELHRNFFRFDIQKNTPIILRKKDTELHLIYEPIYTKKEHSYPSQLVLSKDTRQTPDFVIEIHKNGNIQCILLFEIKYRREKARSNDPWSNFDNGKNQIYTYKNQIMPKRPDSIKKDQEPLVKFGFLVAPLPHAEILEEDHGSVRAIPLLPEMSKHKRSIVNNNLKEALFSLLTLQDK